MSTPTDILSIAETGQAEELQATLREKCDRSLYFFAKAVLGYKDLNDTLHWEMCERVACEDLKQGYLVPRGHFKSTILTKAEALWSVCKDPEERILIVGESDTVASKNLRDIDWHIRNNQILNWLYPALRPPDFNSAKWTNTEMCVPRKGTYDESTFTSVGIGAKLTGFHYTKIIYDDVFGEVASRSLAEAERVVEWVQYAPGLLVDPERSKERWVGTRWKHGDGDIYGWIMANMPYVVWYRRSAIEDGQPIFPERYSLSRLEEIRAREGDYKFACQFLNDPTPPEGSDFPPSWIKWYHVDKDENGRLTILVPEDGSPPVYSGTLYRLSFYDPSSGGKSAKCENAITVLGTAADGRNFVLENWAMNCTYGDAIEKWHLLKDQFYTRDDFYECVGAQKEVEEIVKLRRMVTRCPACGTIHRFLSAKPMKPPGGGRLNKEDRIRLYAQEKFQRGQVYMRRGQEALRNQVVSFPHLTLVDRFDTLAYALHLTRRPLSDEETADEKAKKAAFDARRTPRSNTEINYGGYV